MLLSYNMLPCACYSQEGAPGLPIFRVGKDHLGSIFLPCMAVVQSLPIHGCRIAGV